MTVVWLNTLIVKKCCYSKLKSFFASLFFFLLIFFVLPSSAYAATLYIDGTLSGNCSSNYSITARACSGTDGNAYNTVSGGMGAASGGDTILIREGTYTINSPITLTFSSVSTTTIQSHNSESVTLYKPAIAGTTFDLSASAKNILISGIRFTSNPYEVITGWTLYSGNVWQAALSTSPNQLRFNTTNGTLAPSLVAVDVANEYFYTSGTIYAYSVGDPATTYTSPGINVADNFNGMAIGNPSLSAAGNLITVDNCIFENFSHSAIKGTYRWHVKNSKFLNTGTDMNDHHVYPTGVQTVGNEMIIEYNYFGYSPGAGLHLFTSPAYAIVRYNVFNGLSGSSRGAWGVLIAGPNHRIYNNTIYGYVSGATLYRNTCQNNIVKNNIFTNNTQDLAVDTGGGNYPINNTVETNYLGSNSKCNGCIDYTGSGGPNLLALDDAPPNTYSTSPWTQFSQGSNSKNESSSQQI